MIWLLDTPIGNGNFNSITHINIYGYNFEANERAVDVQLEYGHMNDQDKFIMDPIMDGLQLDPGYRMISEIGKPFMAASMPLNMDTSVFDQSGYFIYMKLAELEIIPPGTLV